MSLDHSYSRNQTTKQKWTLTDLVVLIICLSVLYNHSIYKKQLNSLSSYLFFSCFKPFWGVSYILIPQLTPQLIPHATYYVQLGFQVMAIAFPFSIHYYDLITYVWHIFFLKLFAIRTFSKIAFEEVIDIDTVIKEYSTSRLSSFTLSLDAINQLFINDIHDFCCLFASKCSSKFIYVDFF